MGEQGFKIQDSSLALLLYINNRPIDPIHEGLSLFLSCTNMNKMNSLPHVKEHPTNFLQFESRSSKSFKVRTISDLRDLYGNSVSLVLVMPLVFRPDEFPIQSQSVLFRLFYFILSLFLQLPTGNSWLFFI